MRRLFLVAVAAAVVLSVYGQQEMKMEPPKKPEPAAEMAKLKPFIGAWADRGEIISPLPAEMKAKTPEGAPEDSPITFAGGWKSAWALGGMFLKNEGWHDMGPEQRANYVEYVTWDAKEKKFHGWFFSDWGESGESWWTLDPDGKTFRITAKGTKPDGAPTTGKGTFTFVGDEKLEWTWSEEGPEGKMQFKGTSSRRQP